MKARRQVNSREPGELGLAIEEAVESRRSKLVPYGLLSSSFHIMRGRGLRLELDSANGCVQIVVVNANEENNHPAST